MWIGVLFVLGGVFVIAAVGLRWEWFISHYKVANIFRRLGKTGAMILYVASGIAFVVVGILILLGLIS